MLSRLRELLVVQGGCLLYTSPAGNRGSSKAQVDGCCGRANMLVTDHEPKDWGLDVGTMELGNTPRDLSVEDQIPLIQNFVQYRCV